MKPRRFANLSPILLFTLAAACGATSGGPTSDADLAAGDQGADEHSGEAEFEQETPSSPSALAGGQSGGQSGTEASSLACHCGFSDFAEAYVITPDAQGHCAVFELLQKPAGAEDYFGLEVGDYFGGSGQLLCGLGLEIEAGERVYVKYTPGQQDGDSCSEYRDCAEAECGNISDFTSNPETDPEAYASEEAAWAACRQECVSTTAQECSEHAEVARFAGQVVVAQRGMSGEVVYTDLEGDTYAITETDGLSESDCDVDAVLIATGAPPEPPAMTNEEGEEIDFYGASPEACAVP